LKSTLVESTPVERDVKAFDPARPSVTAATYGGGSLILAPATDQRMTPMDWKLELVAVPVSDVDRAKAFYTEQAGFNADHDHRVSEQVRFVQLTPPGSACSIALGTGVTDAAPGSVKGLQLVVTDVDAARAELAGRGVEVGEVQQFPWGRFVFFTDPDGNGWSVQELPPRG